MPHNTYQWWDQDIWDSQLIWESAFSEWHQHSLPLYIHSSNIYTKTLYADPAPRDPVKPYFGHWLDNTGIQFQFMNTTQTIWHLPGWTSPTTKRFIRPGQDWEAGKTSFPSSDPKAPSRVLATRKVRTVSTYISDEWLAFLWFVDPIAGAADPGAGHGVWAQAGKKFLGFEDKWHDKGMELFYAAATVGPMPHYHEGYIDEFGNGFTTGVFLSESAFHSDGVPIPESGRLKAIAEYFADYGDDPLIAAADPTHHTHKLLPLNPQSPLFGTYPATVGNAGHIGIFPGGKVAGSDQANTQHDNTVGVSLLGDVNEIIFLESAEVHYSNEELQMVVPGIDHWACDLVPGVCLGLTQDPNVPPAEQVPSAKVLQNLAERQTIFNEHIEYTYKSRIHTHRPFETSKDISNYRVFTDRVFDLDSLPDTQSKGSLISTISFINPIYKNALDAVPNNYHILIPNSYLFGQFAENKERFYKGDDTNTKYGALLTSGLQYLPEPESEFSQAAQFPEGIGMGDYLQLWSRGVSKSEGVDIWNGPTDGSWAGGIPSTPIIGFPKYEFLQEYKPNWPWTHPAMINITINVPRFSNFSFIQLDPEGLGFQAGRGIFIGSKGWPPSESLMLFLMAQVAGNTESTKENYWKRELRSKENLDISSWDLTQYVDQGKYWDLTTAADAKDLLQHNDLISYDFGGLENWEENFFDIGAALAYLGDWIRFSGRLRSTYEILNPPLEWKKQGWSPNPAGGMDLQYHAFGNHVHPYAHNEVMFYEIEKKKGDTILQRFFITKPTPEQWNSNEQSTIEYIDSQLKFNKEYRYTVYSYVLSIGNEYRYQDIQPTDFAAANMVHKSEKWDPSYDTYYVWTINTETWNPDTAPEQWPNAPSVATIYAINKPKIELLKIPYIEFAPVYITDSPPLHPNVEIYPYQGINNKLLFLLSQYVGEHIDVPIPILPGDEAIFDQIKAAQESDADLAPGEIRFKSDEPDYKYQVFRLEKHPEDWSDFGTALRKELFLEKDFIDDIAPNKKYYYIFRSVDHHDNISNPSPVFEVELVDDSGAIYLNAKIVDFVEKVSRENIKSMRKYVHIVPTLKQSNLSTPQAETIYAAEDTPSGVNLGALFGGEPCTSPDTPSSPRTFKVRFTSKSSGKMFDLNLKFVHEHEGKDDSLVSPFTPFEGADDTTTVTDPATTPGNGVTLLDEPYDWLPEDVDD